MLDYYPPHVSSINMSIFRRTRCILTAFAIVTVCKPVNWCTVQPFNRCTVQPFTESDDTRCCENTIGSPEDGHVNVRNMSKIVV
jgi:hypothetical protein